MRSNEILSQTDHRPFNVPEKNWQWFQAWNRVVFLHWNVDQQLLQKFVPSELKIDTYEDKAWISVVAFIMENVRHKNMISFPPISTFTEVNVRTYVNQNNMPGVYFLSLEAGKRISSFIARMFSKLPYKYADIQTKSNSYELNNAKQQNKLFVEYETGPETTKTLLDSWLTDRYCLYHTENHDVYRYNVHHLEWHINKINIKQLSIDYPMFNSLFNGPPISAQYSFGVDVVAWPRELIS